MNGAGKCAKSEEASSGTKRKGKVDAKPEAKRPRRGSASPASASAVQPRQRSVDTSTAKAKVEPSRQLCEPISLDKKIPSNPAEIQSRINAALKDVAAPVHMVVRSASARQLLRARRKLLSSFIATTAIIPVDGGTATINREQRLLIAFAWGDQKHGPPKSDQVKDRKRRGGRKLGLKSKFPCAEKLTYNEEPNQETFHEFMPTSGSVLHSLAQASLFHAQSAAASLRLTDEDSGCEVPNTEALLDLQEMGVLTVNRVVDVGEAEVPATCPSWATVLLRWAGEVHWYSTETPSSGSLLHSLAQSSLFHSQSPALSLRLIDEDSGRYVPRTEDLLDLSDLGVVTVAQGGTHVWRVCQASQCR